MMKTTAETRRSSHESLQAQNAALQEVVLDRASATLSQSTCHENEQTAIRRHSGRPYAWFDPKHMRLRQLNPRQFGGKITPMSDHPLGAGCNRFVDATRAAIREDVDGQRRFLMPFVGASVTFGVPMNTGAPQPIGPEKSSSPQVDSSESEEDENDSESSVSDDDLESRSPRMLAAHEVSLVDGSTLSKKRESVCEIRRANFSPDRRSSKDKKAQKKINEALEFAADLGSRFCNRKNHPTFLRNQVYAKHCMDIHVRTNSGVERVLLQSASCFCNLEAVSFTSFLLGDRGVEGILPLFKSCHRMKSLYLGGNGLHEKGIRRVATYLADDVTILQALCVLDFSNNPITSSSAPDVLQLLSKRRGILMLGIFGTSLPGVRRQYLLRQSLANFAQADPQDMSKAWQLACPGTAFADGELWVQCTTMVEAQCSREQLAECMELVARYKAGEAAINVSPGLFDRQVSSMSAGSSDKRSELEDEDMSEESSLSERNNRLDGWSGSED